MEEYKIYKVIFNSNDLLPYRVVEADNEGQVRVGFKCSEEAVRYTEELNKIYKLSCCENSLRSNGWNHSPSCDEYFKKISYTGVRRYYKGDHTQLFHQVGLNEWEIDYGYWKGEFKDIKDQLTMTTEIGTTIKFDRFEEVKP